MRTFSSRALRLTALLILISLGASSTPSVRIKDIARIRGVRENQLVGYGLVVGLQGTGDSDRSRFTVLSILSMLRRLGVDMDERSLDPKNTAGVIVTATMPPFAHNGDEIDCIISVLGDAGSLQGGVLLQTPLLAADGTVYAVAQGPLSLGGGEAIQGGGGRGGQGGIHLTTARLPGGAIIERGVSSDFIEPDGTIIWVLRRPDFSTASRLARAINDVYTPDIATALDAEAVRVILPSNYRDDPVSFVSRVEELELNPDAVARVVINERTGTVVFGENISISAVAVAHGALAVTIRGEALPGQAAGLPGAGVGPAPRMGAATLTMEEGNESLVTLPEGSSVRDVVRALNAVGAQPRDIIAILQAIAEAGALHADLEVM